MTYTENTVISESKESIVNSAANTALTVLHFNGVTALAEKAFKNIICNAGITDVSLVWRFDNIMISYKADGKSGILLKPIIS